MEKERLAILQGELKKQYAEIDKIYSKIDRKAKEDLSDDNILESLGYQLHNLYCAYEDLFKVIADFFENNIEEGLSYHRELLWRMSISIEGIRPSLVSEESYQLLSDLRAFRHFFRHAYSYELDPDKLKLVLKKAIKLKSNFKPDLDTFLDKLKI
jgi:uncharacterized protein YutE (UPF0331/DUF86 family)